MRGRGRATLVVPTGAWVGHSSFRRSGGPLSVSGDSTASSNRESRSGRDERWWRRNTEATEADHEPVARVSRLVPRVRNRHRVPHESLLRPLEAGLPPLRKHSVLQSVSLADRWIIATDPQACLLAHSAETGPTGRPSRPNVVQQAALAVTTSRRSPLLPTLRDESTPRICDNGI